MDDGDGRRMGVLQPTPIKSFMCPMPYLAIAFSQSCEWDGLGFLSLRPRLPDSQEPRHLLAGRRRRKAIWESAVNKADRNLCPSGADIVRRDTQSSSKT